MTREDEARELLAVTQADRDAAAAFYGPHLARPGEVLVTAHMRAGKIDESPLIQAFAKHRLALTRPSSPASVEVERIKGAFDQLADAAMGYIKSTTHKLHPDGPNDEPMHPAAAHLHGLAIEVGHLRCVADGTILTDEEAEANRQRLANGERLWSNAEILAARSASLPTARAGIGEDAAQHFKVGDRVTKVKGLPFGNGDARVVAVYSAEGGSRVVVQHPEGWQHIFAPDQLALASLQSSGRDAGEERLKEALEQAFRAGHEAGFDAAENTSRSQQSHENDAWGEYVASLKDHAK